MTAFDNFTTYYVFATTRSGSDVPVDVDCTVTHQQLDCTCTVVTNRIIYFFKFL
jgi:hypothetical protein